MSWTVTNIKSKVRKITGRPSTTQLSDASLLEYINEFYVNKLPQEVLTHERKRFKTFSTIASTGEYLVPSSVVGIRNPVTVTGEQIFLSTDPVKFFSDYPDTDTTTSKPERMLMIDSQADGDRWFYLRPEPDAAYTMKYLAIEVPTAFTDDADVPLDDKWGPAIAYGAAIDIFIDYGQEVPAAVAAAYDYNINSINRKQLQIQKPEQRGRPTF